MSKFTFINAFEIPEGKEEIFHKEWPLVVERLKEANGLLSVRLYEADADIEKQLLRVPEVSGRLQERSSARARFYFMVVAEWASVEHYEAVIRSSRQSQAGQSLLNFTSYPAYYRIAFEHTI